LQGASVTLSQTLSATWESDRTYTFSALVGNRIFSPSLAHSYRIDLLAGNNPVGNSALTPLVATANDSSGLLSFSVTTSSNFAFAGIPIGLSLFTASPGGVLVAWKRLRAA
jgi:hypothetical protein